VPTHRPPQYSPEAASAFGDASVAGAYRHRPPYPPAVFSILLGLIADAPAVVLDAGSGEGSLARGLAPLVDRVDAVDLSAAMVEVGRSLPGGDHPALRWLVGPVETVDLHPPYALITACESVHWFDWDVALPRFHDLLTPSGMLAVVERHQAPRPWSDALNRTLIPRYSTHRDFDAGFDMVAEWKRFGLIEPVGQAETPAVPFRQSVDDYIESLFSASSFSRDRMSPGEAAAFAAAVRELVAPHVAPDGMLDLEISAGVGWARPLSPGLPAF
jgi:SAM-dependent methyltransferase